MVAFWLVGSHVWWWGDGAKRVVLLMAVGVLMVTFWLFGSHVWWWRRVVGREVLVNGGSCFNGGALAGWAACLVVRVGGG